MKFHSLILCLHVFDQQGIRSPKGDEDVHRVSKSGNKKRGSGEREERRDHVSDCVLDIPLVH